MLPCSDGVVHGVGEDSLEVMQLEVLVHLVRVRGRADLQPAGREAVASGRDGRGAWAGGTSSGVMEPRPRQEDARLQLQHP